MLEVLGEDYIRTARAKGLSKLRVVALHALRNALIPVITVIGLQVGVLFTGAILTETIFSWPGVGKWLIEAINRRDYPVLQGGVLLLGLRRDDGQPAGRRHLRHHQSADPARVMTPSRRTAAASTAAARRRGPLREFWGYFSANHGAVAGLVVVVAVLLMAAFANVLAPYPPDLTNNAAFLQAARLAGRRLVGVSARHRRDRPRHPVAADLRRAAVAADRHRGRRAGDRRRHRARARRRLRARRRPRSRSCG